MTPETLIWAVDQTADSVAITNRDGRIEYVNPAFETITGFTPAEVLGRTPRVLRSGIQTASFYATLWHTIQSGHTFHATITNRRRDGRLYDHELSIAPVRDDGGTITHFVSIGRDVTQRQYRDEVRLQQRLDAEAVRVAGVLHDEAGQFLALAHIALADLSHRTSGTDLDRLQEARGYLEYVEQRLRDASRSVQPAMVTTLGLVDAIRFLARCYERRAGIPITVESSLDISCPASIEALLYRFVQDTLANVADHAAATQGVIVLERRARGRRADDQLVCCSVRDNGSGLAAGQFEGAPERQLSLRVLQGHLEAVGGSLTIQSEPGAGTEVCATVPLETSPRF